MHFVLLATHSPEACPTSNGKTRELLLQMGPQIPSIAEKCDVKILSGPFLSREHVTVVIVEADSAENLDHFIMESRLSQWNSVRVLPALPMEQGMREIQEQPVVF